MTNKEYIRLSIQKHASITALKGILLDELENIDDNNINALVTFMGSVNTHISGAFKQADEFIAQGISNPSVLAQFTPLASGASDALKLAGKGLVATGPVVSIHTDDTSIIADEGGVSVNLAYNLGHPRGLELTNSTTVKGLGVMVDDFTITFGARGELVSTTGRFIDELRSQIQNLTNYVNSFHQVNVTSLAGNGLGVSGPNNNILNVNLGSGLTFNNGNITLTYLVGDLSTMASSPDSVVAILGTGSLQTRAGTIIDGINELLQSNQNLTNYVNSFHQVNVTSLAGNGLGVSGPNNNILNVNLGSGLTFGDNGNITLTYLVGDLSTMASSPDSVVAILGTGSLQTSAGTIIDGMNELLQGSNQLHSQIQNLPGVQQVRDSSNRDNIDVNTAIAGANPTAPNSGLAALNSDISNRQDLVHATNALYAQKPIFLSSLCMSNIEQEIQDWINLMSKMLMNPITYPNNNLPVILLSMRCLNIVAVIASGSEAKTTVQGKDKNECSTLWQKEIEGSQNSGELIEYLKNPHTGDILGSLIQNEICAQYDV